MQNSALIIAAQRATARPERQYYECGQGIGKAQLILVAAPCLDTSVVDSRYMAWHDAAGARCRVEVVRTALRPTLRKDEGSDTWLTCRTCRTHRQQLILCLPDFLHVSVMISYSLT